MPHTKQNYRKHYLKKVQLRDIILKECSSLKNKTLEMPDSKIHYRQLAFQAQPQIFRKPSQICF